MSSQPEGLSFTVSELCLVQAWAEFHDLRLAVELDHAPGGETYEEVLALYRKGSAHRRCVLWRTPTKVVLEPIIGRASRFPSIADALDSFGLAAPDEPLTDIVPGPFAFGPRGVASRSEPATNKAA